MSFVLKMLLNVLPGVFGLITPTLREAFHQMVKDLYAKAKQTPNPVDDVFVATLAGLLGVELEG